MPKEGSLKAGEEIEFTCDYAGVLIERDGQLTAYGMAMLGGRRPAPPVETTKPLAHDFSDPYCATSNVQRCRNCGSTEGSAAPCIGHDWRTTIEVEVFKNTAKPHRPNRAAAIASLGGYPGHERDVSGVGVLVDGCFNVAPERS